MILGRSRAKFPENFRFSRSKLLNSVRILRFRAWIYRVFVRFLPLRAWIYRDFVRFLSFRAWIYRNFTRNLALLCAECFDEFGENRWHGRDRTSRSIF